MLLHARAQVLVSARETRRCRRVSILCVREAEHAMPMGAHDHLDGLYARQRLLTEEAARLESERDLLDPGTERSYILEIEIAALRQESSRISSRISDVLDRDLQR